MRMPWRLTLKTGSIFLIDAFGGSHIGDVTANLIKKTVKKTYTKISRDPEATHPFFYSQKYLIEGNALINAFYHAHSAVIKENEKKKMEHRGGASITAVCESDDIVTLIGTGNCSAYLYRRGKLKQLIFPDTLESFSFNDYEKHLSTTPMSGVGLFPDLALSIGEQRIMDEDILILMSDGAYARMKERELLSILGDGSKNSDEKIDEIFHLSNLRGNLDNQSCLILYY